MTCSTTLEADLPSTCPGSWGPLLYPGPAAGERRSHFTCLSFRAVEEAEEVVDGTKEKENPARLNPPFPCSQATDSSYQIDLKE